MKSPIVGGVFGLELYDRPAQPPFRCEHMLDFVNARSALHWLLGRLAPRTLWIPSYLCDAVLAAARGVCQVAFYEVDRHLQVREGPWMDRLAAEDAVLVIDYFGFRRWQRAAEALRKSGATVIEDAAQALYLARAAEADFIVYSPRKFLGVADGGILCGSFPVAESDTRSQPPLDWWLKAFTATLLRAEFDIGSETRRWFDLFQESERDAPIGNHRMSDLSRAQLCHGIDYQHIRQRRIANYEALAAPLRDLALYPDLEDGVVPVGFPLRVRNRDQVREALFEGEIYPAVHWPIRGIVPPSFEVSHSLADEILTLSCDQRYDDVDMTRAASIIRKAMR